MTTRYRTVDNTEDILDSREIIERIEELEELFLDSFNEQQEIEGFKQSDDSEETYRAESVEDALFSLWLQECRSEEAEEYRSLKALAEECEGYASDWQYGETLIRRSYWVDYVEQMLKDCGDIPDNIPSYIAIDWNETAERIEVDYMSVDFDGVEYLIRSC